ncbi:MAG: VenA family class IV lanthipeptide [Pseudonocardiaceae bacterium]
MSNYDLVCSLQALPETDPVEVDGIQFGPTCVSTNSCVALSVGLLQTLLAGIGVGLGIGLLNGSGTGAGVGC